MKTWIPGICDTLPCTSGSIPVTVRLRSAQGLTTTPLKPSAPSVAPIDGGNSSWKVNAASGMSSMIFSAASA